MSYYLRTVPANAIESWTGGSAGFAPGVILLHAGLAVGIGVADSRSKSNICVRKPPSGN
jgi:hypothetical protein